MFLPADYFIGLRYLLNRKQQGFASFISAVSLIGLVLGVAALVLSLSVMNGFERELRKVVLDMVPQSSVVSSQAIEEWQPFITEINQHPNVIESAPNITLQGMLSYQQNNKGILLSGIIPEYEARVSVLDERMIAGDLSSLNGSEPNIILGKKAVETLGLSMGDAVTVILLEGSNSAIGVTPRFKQYYVSGIYTASHQIESWMGYVSMENAANMLHFPKGTQGIRMKVKDLYAAQETAEQIVAKYPDKPLFANSWITTRGNLMSTLKLQKVMIGLMLLFIILVAAFNIISSLVMVVINKKADVAILKTLGASPRFVERVFIIQGLLIGCVGILVGVLVGIILTIGISPVSFWLNTTFDLHLFDNYYVDRLPYELKLLDIVAVVLVTMLITWLATIYPAKRAAKILPAVTLRHE